MVWWHLVKFGHGFWLSSSKTNILRVFNGGYLREFVALGKLPILLSNESDGKLVEETLMGCLVEFDNELQTLVSI
jgi:hypothetical protein